MEQSTQQVESAGIQMDHVFGVADYADCAEQWSELEKSAAWILDCHRSDATLFQNHWWYSFENVEFGNPDVPVLVEIVCEGALARSLIRWIGAEGAETFQNAEFFGWRVTGDWKASGFVHIGLQCDRATFDVVRQQLEECGIGQQSGPICCATKRKKRKSHKRQSA